MPLLLPGVGPNDVPKGHYANAVFSKRLKVSGHPRISSHFGAGLLGKSILKSLTSSCFAHRPVGVSTASIFRERKTKDNEPWV